MINKFNNLSIKTKILIIFIFSILLLTFIVSILIFTISNSQYDQTLEKSNLLITNNISKQIDNTLTTITNQGFIISEKIRKLKNENNIYHAIYYEELFTELIINMETSNIIYSMIILDQNQSYEYRSNYFSPINNLKPTLTLENADNLIPQNVNYSWVGPIKNSLYYNYHTDDISSYVIRINEFGKLKGILIINIDNSSIINSIDKGDFELFILNNSNDVIFESDKKSNDIINLNWKNSNSVNIRNCVYTKSPIHSTQWQLVSQMEKPNIFQKIDMVFGSFLIFFLIGTGIILLVVMFLSNNIAQPIIKLMNIMSSVKNTDDFVEVDFKYNDEIGQLGKIFNQLMSRIRVLNSNIIKASELNKANYMKLLQTQIKPHFLYNTLLSARYMIDIQDKKASEMVEAIGMFYKLSLSGLSDTTSIQQELLQVENYLKIMKIRYDDSFDYSINIQQGCENCNIIKMLIQPIIENSIYHGIKQIHKHGQILINVISKDDDIYITIKDNGKGINEDDLIKLRKKLENNKNIELGESIGISNVNWRIKTQYGNKYGLFVESIYNTFTEVTMVFPKEKINEGSSIDENI